MSLRFTVKVAAITRPALEYCIAISMIFKKMLGVHENIGVKRIANLALELCANMT
jgi:hypothetical protein